MGMGTALMRHGHGSHEAWALLSWALGLPRGSAAKTRREGREMKGHTETEAFVRIETETRSDTDRDRGAKQV